MRIFVVMLCAYFQCLAFEAKAASKGLPSTSSRNGAHVIGNSQAVRGALMAKKESSPQTKQAIDFLLETNFCDQIANKLAHKSYICGKLNGICYKNASALSLYSLKGIVSSLMGIEIYKDEIIGAIFTTNTFVDYSSMGV